MVRPEPYTTAYEPELTSLSGMATIRGKRATNAVAQSWHVTRSGCSPPFRQFASAGNGPMMPTMLRVASSVTIGSMSLGMSFLSPKGFWTMLDM